MDFQPQIPSSSGDLTNATGPKIARPNIYTLKRKINRICDSVSAQPSEDCVKDLYISAFATRQLLEVACEAIDLKLETSKLVSRAAVSQYRELQDQLRQHIAAFDQFSHQDAKIVRMPADEAPESAKPSLLLDKLDECFLVTKLFDSTSELIDQLTSAYELADQFEPKRSRLEITVDSIQAAFSTSANPISAGCVLNNALFEVRMLVTTTLPGLAMFQVALPYIFSTNPLIDENEADEAQPKPLSKYSTLDRSELLKLISAHAARLGEVEQLFSRECASLLLSEDLQLSEFRRMLNSYRFIASEIKTSCDKLDCEQAHQAKSDFVRNISFIKPFSRFSRYSTMLGLLASLSRGVLDETVSELETRKNSLNVLNPEREQFEGALKVLFDGLELINGCLEELVELTACYSEKLMAS